jgi:hemolysin III
MIDHLLGESLQLFREPFNGLTHLFASFLSLAAVAVFSRRAKDDPLKRASLLFFGWTLVLLFGASALYHLPRWAPRGLEWARRLDHAAIFLLILGTYTGICVNVLVGSWRTSILTLVWTIGLLGIAEKLLFFRLPEPASVSLYVGLGWIGLAAFPMLARIFGICPLAWIVGGGISYTSGALADCLELRWAGSLLTPHQVFHLAAMLGAFLHFQFILRFVVPFPRVPWGQISQPLYPLPTKSLTPRA